ncbi:MAG: HAMP domain-containing protein [Firmicutes bacterium]|nr:HAMP domain-containing protein [Bacillota bacterium]
MKGLGLKVTTAVLLTVVASTLAVGLIIIGRQGSASGEDAATTRLILLFSVLIAGGIATAVGSRLASGIIQPVEQMTDVARSLSTGDFSRYAFVNRDDELSALGEALNEMSASVRRMLEAASTGKGHLEAVLSTMESGVVFIDSHGRVSMVNTAAVKIFNLQDAYLGRPHVEVLRNYQISAEVDRAITTGSSMRLEVNVIYPQERSLEVFLNPLAGGPNGSGVVVVFHDVTELKRLEKIRRDFVANVSHELKTPVTSVKGFAETLLDGAISDPATAREFVEIIFREASRLDMLVRDLVDLSNLESAPVPIKPVPDDLRDSVQASTRKAALKAGPAGVNVRLRTPGEPVICPIDGERIEQVMDNLLDNAIKFTPRGGVVEVSLEVQGNYAVVTVADTGCGIPPEDLPRIFERFYTVDKARSKKTGGTGLGLSIVKHTVDLHGGRVQVESEYGKGSSFHFSIPLFSNHMPRAGAS